MSQYPLRSRKIQDAIEAGYSFIFNDKTAYIYHHNLIIHTINLDTIRKSLEYNTLTYNLYLNIIHSKSKFKTVAGIKAYKYTKYLLYDYVINTTILKYFKKEL
jgi:hypothetical protein